MYHLIYSNNKNFLIVETPSYKTSTWSYKIPLFVPNMAYNFGADMYKNKPIEETISLCKGSLKLIVSSKTSDFRAKYPSDTPIEDYFPELLI